MSLRISQMAPDFTAETSQGKINFHDWIGDSWAMLFSHPKDFTPICATELSAAAKMNPEFEKRGVKLIGLSVDNVSDHVRWVKDIEDIGGAKLTFPIIADDDLEVAKLFDMLEAEDSSSSEGRTAAQNQTVRTVFLIGTDKKIKMEFRRAPESG